MTLKAEDKVTHKRANGSALAPVLFGSLRDDTHV